MIDPQWLCIPVLCAASVAAWAANPFGDSPLGWSHAESTRRLTAISFRAGASAAAAAVPAVLFHLAGWL